MTKVRAVVTERPGRIRVHELLTTETGNADGPCAWRGEVVSYAESFRQKLQHFRECAVCVHAAATSAEDALRDMALCQAVAASHRSRLRRHLPTAA
jgi:hypothetical protein